MRDLLQVGPAEARGVTLVVGPLHTSIGAEMLLGLDWLSRHEVWIAYRDHKVYVRTP